MPAILTATPRLNELALDWRALAFTAITTLLATVIVSVVPAVVGTRRDLHQMMAAGSRGVAGGRYRFQQGLVVAQVALSVTLVGSATLLLRSYYNLTIVDRGFDPSGVMTFHVAAAGPRIGIASDCCRRSCCPNLVSCRTCRPRA